MGSLEDSEELFPIEYGVPTIAFAYDDPLSYSGVIKAVILDDLELLQELVSQGKSARIVDNHGNTPLHIAAYRATNLELIKYLLSLEEVDINARNHYGHTPLLLSVLKSKETSAYILIKTGADVNIASNEDITPLHHSVRFSTKLSEALILAGAIIDQIDYDKDTALHDTIVFGNMETLCMLLYYGADTSIKNSAGLTPFMQSLAADKCQFADELFEYEIDFNNVTIDGMSTLFLAIATRYSRTAEIIERGADVNFTNEYYNIFNLGVAPSLDVFRCIWKRFDYEKIWLKDLPNILIFILNYTNLNLDCSEEDTINYKMEALRIILEGDFDKTYLTMETEIFALMHPLVLKLAKLKASHDVVHTFCCILLSYNLKVYDIDLDMVYEFYGYCELFKLLLHMDIFHAPIERFTYFPQIIYEFDRYYERKAFSVSEKSYLKLDYEYIFDHLLAIDLKKKLKDLDGENLEHLHKYISAFPEVPLLQELARDAARQLLCDKYKIKNSMQFYTILKHIDIPDITKKLIAFEIPIYRKYLTPALFRYRNEFKQIRLEELYEFESLIYDVVLGDY